MKWIGQNIWSFISRFRSDVYLEDISTGTIASGSHLGLDSNNKIVKAADGGGDLTSIVAGTGLSGTSLTGPIPTLNVNESQTQITSVGDIGTGRWEASVIESAYLDADTAHLTTDQTFTGGKTFENDQTYFTSANANDPLVIIKNTADDATSGRLRFLNQRGADGQDNDETGIIEFFGYDDGSPSGERYSRIIGTIDDATAGQESGKLTLQVASHDGGDEDGLVLTGGSVDAEVDVVVGNGTASTTTITGTLTMGSTAAMTNSGLVSVVNQSNITGLGTISSGVWQGTTIKTAYIGDDQVTEDKLANTLLAEIDANTAKATNVTTNLSISTGTTTARINSSDGSTTAVIPVATTSVGGVMSAAIFDEHTANNAKNTSSNVYDAYIRLLPSDFSTNADGGNTKHGIGYVSAAGSGYGIKVPSADTELFAFVSIPEGMKATHVEIFGLRDRGVEVFEVQINATTVVSKGTGNCNTEFAINNSGESAGIAATATNLLAIEIDTVSTTADRVYGGRVKIAAQ